MSAAPAPALALAPALAPAGAALLAARIWHGRQGDAALAGARRDFAYRATYLRLPVDLLDAGPAVRRLDPLGLWRLARADHGPRDGSALRPFAEAAIGAQGLDLTLVTLPRSRLGGFNPVSFWLGQDAQGLRAVIAEVSNTFGERHLYVVRHPDLAPIAPTDRISGEKMFHVSPFLPREGRYTFRFDARPERFGAFIDWTNGTTRLGTSLAGPARPATARALAAAALRRPCPAQAALGLIHLQAARIALARLPFHRKPAPAAPALTTVTSPSEGPGHV